MMQDWSGTTPGGGSRSDAARPPGVRINQAGYTPSPGPTIVPGSTVDQSAAIPTPGPHAPTTGQELQALNASNQTDLGSFSSYNPSSGPDPRDATYWANVAKLLSTSQQDYASGQLAQSQSDVTYGLQRGTMEQDRQKNVRNIAESLIGQGLLRSGTHNRRQTEATGDYLNAVAGMETSKSQEDQRRQATMAAILSNLGIDEQGLYADAANRYADRQAQAAANATPTAPVTYDTTADTGGGGFLGSKPAPNHPGMRWENWGGTWKLVRK